MKNLLLIFIIFMFGIIGCKNRQGEQNSISENIQMEGIIKNTDSSLYTENKVDSEIVPYIQGSRRVMYVNLSSGLKGHVEPSENSTVIRTLLHGQRIVIDEVTNQPDTIDEITNYWYRTYFWNEARTWAFGDRLWLFGAYLSENIPYDAFALLGKWYYRDEAVSEDNCEFIRHYNFYADGSYRKDEYLYIQNIGTWIFDGNTISIQSHSRGENGWSEEYEILNAQLIIIDSNNIKLIWLNGKISELVRCNYAGEKN